MRSYVVTIVACLAAAAAGDEDECIARFCVGGSDNAVCGVVNVGGATELRRFSSACSAQCAGVVHTGEGLPSTLDFVSEGHLLRKKLAPIPIFFPEIVLLAFIPQAHARPRAVTAPARAL
jgi:hypothetical protein